MTQSSDQDIRCDSKLHGKLIEPNVLEFKCSSKFCGAEPGVVVLHQFRLTDGNVESIGTSRYKDPERREKSATNNEASSLRSP